MFDEDGADQAYAAQAKLLTPKAQQPTAWQGFWGAAAKAVPAAINETARALGSLAMKTTFVSGQDSDEFRQANDQAAKEIDVVLKKGVDYWTPDATTTGSASQIVHSFGKTITKIAGYAVTGGTPLLIGGLSADEGINESLRLQDSGVDPATANLAGTVRGATTAVGTLLPAAGSTIAKTAALALAGGPASFVADQAAIKYILENADYKAKAAEYDPFDMTGILLAAGVSAVAGGAAHGLRARAKLNQERQRSLLPEAQTVESAGVRVDVETEAAARTMQTVHAMQEKALTPADDLTGQIKHQQAMEATIRQMDESAPVNVVGRVDATEAQINARMPVDQARLVQPSSIDEVLYRGTKKEGQQSSTEAVFLSPDRAYAEQYGAVQEFDLPSGHRALDLQQFKGVDNFEQVHAYLDSVLGPKLAARLMEAKGVQANPDSMLMDTYSILRGKGNVKLLRDNGIDVVRYNQLDGNGADAKSVAVLNKQLLKQRASDSGNAPLPKEPAASQSANPELDAARQAVAADDLPVVAGYDDANNPIVRSAREMLDEAEATEIQAQTDSKAFKAAVLCDIGSSE